MIGKDYDLHNLTPAYYKLGLWRITYLQKKCCVCHIHPKSYSKSNLKPSYNHSLSSVSFTKGYSLLCKRCHDDRKWLLSIRNLPLLTDYHKSQSNILSLPVLSLPVQIATTYTGYIKAAMVAFKYKEDLSALPVLVYAIRQLPRPVGCQANNSVIVPMPTTSKRLRKRGFDPVTILSYFLAEHWNIPLWHGVIRIKDSQSQQGLSRIERLSNLNNVFALENSPPVSNLLIFDDVMTTGASLSAIASDILSANEHLKLSAYAIAHGN